METNRDSLFCTTAVQQTRNGVFIVPTLHIYGRFSDMIDFGLEVELQVSELLACENCHHYFMLCNTRSEMLAFLLSVI